MGDTPKASWTPSSHCLGLDCPCGRRAPWGHSLLPSSPPSTSVAQTQRAGCPPGKYMGKTQVLPWPERVVTKCQEPLFLL